MIGTGANDPQKMDPKASRETLDHSIMYIFAVALQDGRWHHVKTTRRVAPAAPTPSALAQDRDREDPEWTRRYLSHDPQQKPLAAASWSAEGRQPIVDEIAVANAHPLGASRSSGRTTSASSRR